MKIFQRGEEKRGIKSERKVASVKSASQVQLPLGGNDIPI